MNEDNELNNLGRRVALKRKEEERRAELKAQHRVGVRESIEKAATEQRRRAKTMSGSAVTWSLPEAIGWIAFRHLRHLPLDDGHGLEHVLLAEIYDHQYERNAQDYDPRRELQNATNLLWEAMLDGEITAYGKPLNGGEPGALKSELWAMLEQDWYENIVRWTDGGEKAYRGLTLRRSRIEELWPFIGDRLQWLEEVQDKDAAPDRSAKKFSEVDLTKYRADVANAVCASPTRPPQGRGRDFWIREAMGRGIPKQRAEREYLVALDDARANAPDHLWGKKGRRAKVG